MITTHVLDTTLGKPGANIAVELEGDDQVVQHTTTDLLINDVPALIEYISTILPLTAGDGIVSGTCGGVGSRTTAGGASAPPPVTWGRWAGSWARWQRSASSSSTCSELAVSGSEMDATWLRRMRAGFRYPPAKTSDLGSQTTIAQARLAPHHQQIPPDALSREVTG